MDNEINNLITNLNELEDALLIGMLRQKLNDLQKINIPKPILTEHNFRCAKVGMIRTVADTLNKARGKGIHRTYINSWEPLYKECENILNDPKLSDIIKLKTLVNKMKRKLLNIKLKQNETS